MKNYLIEYLKKNWKHLAAGVISFILLMLAKMGDLNPDQALIISGILNALGLTLTTNSGTVEQQVTMDNGNVKPVTPVK